jgi:hypothetical protein
MPDSFSSPATPEPSSPLIQRLERRRTEPVGLVNSLRFQPSAAKIPQAIVQRAALVQQLQTRYGTHTNEIAESELVLANPPALEVPTDTFSTVASSIAAIKKEGRRQEAEGRQSKAELIQRSPANTSLPSASSTHKKESTKEDNREGLKSQLIENHHNFRSTQPKAQSTSPINPSSEGQFRVSRKAIPKISHMGASTTIQAKSESTASSPLELIQRSPRNTSLPIASSATTTQAKLDTDDSVNSLLPTTNEMPLTTAVTTDLPLSQMSLSAQSTLVQMKAATMASLPLSPAELIQRSPTSLPTASQLPVVSELPLSSQQIQRVNNEDVVDLGYIDFPRFDNSARAITQPANLAQENGYVSIQGIEANYARTNRGRENPPAALPLNTGSVSESISGVAPTVTAHQPLSNEVVVPVMPSQHPNSSISEVDVTQVAEQVSRILFRQLRIERERRGFGR